MNSFIFYISLSYFYSNEIHLATLAVLKKARKKEFPFCHLTNKIFVM